MAIRSPHPPPHACPAPPKLSLARTIEIKFASFIKLPLPSDLFCRSHHPHKFYQLPFSIPAGDDSPKTFCVYFLLKPQLTTRATAKIAANAVLWIGWCLDRLVSDAGERVNRVVLTNQVVVLIVNKCEYRKSYLSAEWNFNSNKSPTVVRDGGGATFTAVENTTHC